MLYTEADYKNATISNTLLPQLMTGEVKNE